MQSSVTLASQPKHAMEPEMSETNQPLQILRMKHVQQRTGLSRSAIYDRLNARSPRHDDEFPKPFKLGDSAIGFLEHEINEWILISRSRTLRRPKKILKSPHLAN